MRLIIMMSFFTLVVASSFAQNKNSIGLRVGISQPTVYTSTTYRINDGFKFTPTIGIFFKHQFASSWQVIAEFNHDERGWLKDFGRIRNNYRIFYISLPVILAYTWGSEIEKNVFIGPNIGYIYKGVTEGAPYAYYQVDDRVLLDYSAVVGVGCAIPLEDHFKLHVDLRYHRAFNEVTPDNPGNIKTHGLIGAVGLSYCF